MERDYKEESAQALKYVQDLKSSGSQWEALDSDEYTQELRKFEDEVLTNEGLWNTCNFGYTIEFTISRYDFERKSQILEYSSNRLSKGRWRTMRCNTCAEHSDGRQDIHVDIDHSMDWQEQRDDKLVDYKLMSLLREKYPFGTIHVNSSTLDAILCTLEFGSDLYRELSLHIDEGREAAKLITYYH